MSQSNGFAFHQAVVGVIRRATLDGREHLVAPVIAVRAGVLNGMLCPAEEIGRYPDAWNGIPVPVNHPMDRGTPISANQPNLIESIVIGRFFGASFDGQALHGELWVDVAKARELGGEALQVLQRLEAGQPLEVSTAYFHDTEPVSGAYGGTPYDGIQRNLRPDHLAVLPGAIGACSWADGCGAPRLNQSEVGGVVNVKLNPAALWFNARRKDGVLAAMRLARAQMGLNEDLSHEQVWDLLEQEMRRVTGDPMSFWIQDVYDESFVYRTGSSYSPLFGGKLYRRTHSIDEDQNVTLGEPEEVVREVTYRSVAANATTAQQPTTTAPAAPPMSSEPAGVEPVSTASQPVAANTAPRSGAEEEGKLKKSIIDGLIANQANGLEESDRLWLDGLTEDQLKKLQAAASQPAGNAGNCPGNAPAPAPAAQPAAEPKPAAQPTANAKPVTADEYIAAAPPEIRELLANGVRAERERRQGLLTALSANQRCAFSQEELGAMSTDQLDKLARSLSSEDYSGRGVPRANESTDKIPAPPPVVMAPKEAK